MVEYTQEQINEMIENAKKGLFTEDDLNRRVTAEVDRRVESGIQKGIETQRKKWEEEFNRKAQMTAEELAQEKLSEQLKILSSKESEIQKRSNLIDAKDMLASASVPKSHYDKFIDVLVTSDAEMTKANVTNFINMFNDTKKEIETQIKSELTKITPPPTPTGDKVVTKEMFTKMSYSEKLKFKEENSEKYKEFIK